MNKVYLTLLLLLSPFFCAESFSQNPFFSYRYYHFEGSVRSDLAVVMDLCADGRQNTLSGSYYYASSGHRLELSGKMSADGTVQLTETDENGRISGKFTGKITKNGFVGTWENAKKTTVLAFKLTENYNNGSLTLKGIGLDEEYKERKLSARFTKALLESGNEKINAVFFRAFFGETAKSAKKTGTELLTNNKIDYHTEFKELIRDLDDSELARFPPNFSNCFFTVKYNRDNLLSFSIYDNQFTGGAHNLYNYTHVLLDSETGEKIELGDIFTAGSDALISGFVKEYLAKNRPKEKGFYAEDLAPAPNFYISRYGIYFHYNIYEIAPFSEGDIVVFLSWKKLKPFLKADAPIYKMQPLFY